MIQTILSIIIAFAVYDYILMPFFEYVRDMLLPVLRRFDSWWHDEPHLDERDFLVAYRHWMQESASNPEVYEEFLDETGGILLKICPKCTRFKRNFAKEGRNRTCMDCEFKIGEKDA